MKNDNDNEQYLTQNTKVKTFYIGINFELGKKIEQLLLNYYHFENILVNIISKNYNLYKRGMDVNDYHILTSPRLIINILYYYNYQYSEQQEYLRNKYKDNQLWQALKETAKKLNPYNLTYIIERVRTAFDTYFTNLELYEQNPNLFQEMPLSPIARNFSKPTNYSIELDKYASLSFLRLEKDNLVGINLSDQMVYIPVTKEQVKKLIEIERLFSVKVVYDNEDLYLQISYLKELNGTKNEQIKHKVENYKSKHITKDEQVKYAGIDIGERNLMAVFVDDENTLSLLVDGEPFKHNENMESIIEQLQKMVRLVFEYLHLHKVTDIYTSKNLANHNLAKIPFIKLIEAIEHEAQEYEIKVHYVDESFTSKASCISDDIKSIIGNRLKPSSIKSILENLNLSRVFNGKRSSHGTMFFDTVINEKFYADLNAAVNHIKVGTDKNFEWLKDKLFKLQDPIKITSEKEFREILMKLQDTKPDI